jgi:hypothetical protein
MQLFVLSVATALSAWAAANSKSKVNGADPAKDDGWPIVGNVGHWAPDRRRHEFGL